MSTSKYELLEALQAEFNLDRQRCWDKLPKKDKLQILLRQINTTLGLYTDNKYNKLSLEVIKKLSCMGLCSWPLDKQVHSELEEEIPF